jgi:hypothetical protein
MAVPPNNQINVAGPIRENDIVLRASEIGETIPGIASLAMKQGRKGARRGIQGMYQIPESQEPTPDYMNVSQQNLNNEARQMAANLNTVAPMGERLAYISEEEAGVLRLLGGSGEMTPAGIPSFVDAGYGGGLGSGYGTNKGSGGHHGNGGWSSGYSPDPFGQFGQGPGVGQDAPGTGDYAGTGGFAGPDAERNQDIRDAQAEVTSESGLVTDSEGNLVAAGKALGDYRAEKAAEAAREAFAQSKIDALGDYAAEGKTRDQAYAMAGLQDVESIGLQNMEAGDVLGSMQDRLGDLTDKDKKSTQDLTEMAELNTFFGKPEFEGMSFTESFYDLPADLAALGNVMGTGLGVAGLFFGGPLTKISSAMKLYGKYKKPKDLDRSISTIPSRYDAEDADATPEKTSFADTMDKALDALGIGRSASMIASGDLAGLIAGGLTANQIAQKYGYGYKPEGTIRGWLGIGDDDNGDSTDGPMYAGLPSTYGGTDFGRGDHLGEGRGRQRPMEDIIQQIQEEEEIPVDLGEEDRFQRAFANRYYTGPTTLDEIRKYATVGGYEQMSPYGIG